LVASIQWTPPAFAWTCAGIAVPSATEAKPGVALPFGVIAMSCPESATHRCVPSAAGAMSVGATPPVMAKTSGVVGAGQLAPGTTRATCAALWSTIHNASAVAVMAVGWARPVLCVLTVAPPVVSQVSVPPESITHMSPSGPSVRSTGLAVKVPGNSVTPPSGRRMRPRCLVAASTNHGFPAKPTTIFVGAVPPGTATGGATTPPSVA
jgi:hypothetical protein